MVLPGLTVLFTMSSNGSTAPPSRSAVLAMCPHPRTCRRPTHILFPVRSAPRSQAHLASWSTRTGTAEWSSKRRARTRGWLICRSDVDRVCSPLAQRRLRSKSGTQKRTPRRGKCGESSGSAGQFPSIYSFGTRVLIEIVVGLAKSS